MDRQGSGYDAYVPRVASEWDTVAAGSLWRGIDGSLVFVDISGFTNLAERLAERGRIGAEELTAVLDRVFGRMLDRAYERGGGLLKFGGDALLLLFDTEDHVQQAVASAVEMRSELRSASREKTSVGRIDLKMSVGVHTGLIDFFLVGTSHREMLVGGPVASETVEMEGLADPGEIVVSSAVKVALPDDFTGDPKGAGWLFRKRVVNHAPGGLVERADTDDETMVQFVSRGLRSHLASGISDSEHRIGTVGFVKYSGLDALISEHGPEETARRMDRLVSVIQEAADQEDVTFLASDVDADGGKVILTAGVPTSGHDDEGRVLRAARRILDVDLPLNVRIGVNRGHVFAGEVGTEVRRTFTVMGDTVNLAARLMAAAPYGGLLATPGVLDRSSTLFRTEKLEPFSVKGKEQPVQSFAVFEETGSRPPEHRHELPFTGRSAELAAVLEAAGGDAGGVTVSGETGIGKSRLVQEALEELPGAPITLTIQAEPNSTDNPYWAFRDPMRRLLGIERRAQVEMVADLEGRVADAAPDLVPFIPLVGDVLHIDVDDTPETSSVEPKHRPDRIADTLVTLLGEIETDGLVAVAEDLHWMDGASRSLLERIGSESRSRPWHLIATTRPDEDDTDPIGRAIELEPLAADDTRALVIDSTAAIDLHPDDVDAITARSGGNPLFLSEILRLVRDAGSLGEIPESLDGVVTTEIDTLPMLTRQILRYSAVLGRSFRRVVLDEYLAPEEIELDEATRRDLARYIDEDGPTRWRFRHAVVQSVSYEGLSFRKRRELHHRAGDVIERLAGEDTDAVAEFLAHHFGLAGEHEKTWRYSLIAAERAAERYANAEAAEHLRRAIDVSRRVDVDDDELAGIWTKLGDALEQGARFEEAVDAFRHAARLANEPVVLADIELRSARARLRLGSYPAAMADLTRGEQRLPERDGDQVEAVRARLWSFRSVVRRSQGKPREALDFAERAVRLAEPVAEREALARAYGVMDWAQWMLGRPDLAVNSDRALELYLDLGQLDLAANILNNKGAFAYFEGRWDDAIELYGESRDAFRRAGNVAGAALTAANIAEILISRGALEDAGPLISEAVRVLSSIDAEEDVVFAETQRARLLIGSGEAEAALELFESLRKRAETARLSMAVVELSCRAAGALMDLDRPSDAVEMLDRLEARAGSEAAPFAPLVARIRAHATVAQGDPDSVASRLVEKGLADAEELGADYERLRLLELKAEMTEGGPAAETSDEISALRNRLGVTPGEWVLSRT